jgi:hypothetical protein
MPATQVVARLLGVLASRLVEARRGRDGGDVAEKIVIVGFFVALAIAMGVLITHAVDGDATRIVRQIGGAP